ncbi:MAG: DUF6591 domain-containing protein [Bacteroidota bacterium]
MKNIALLALSSIFLLGVSCKNKQKTAENSKDDSKVMISGSKENESSDAVGFEKAKDCDDFIDQYEAWSEEYVAFLTKYKDDPIKAVTSPEYAQMMQKASSWSQQWLSLSVSCVQNSSYGKRVTEISDRMDEKVKELGF